MAANDQRKRHLKVDRFHQPAQYKSKRRATSLPVPDRPNAMAHGGRIQQQLTAVSQSYATLAQSWEGNEAITSKGITVELESAVNTEIDPERLENAGWVLLNEKLTGTAAQPALLQIWFVPDGKLAILSNLIGDYLTKTIKVKGGKVQPKYRPLIEAIERIGQAAVGQLWTEIDEAFPLSEAMWFEVWLRGGSSEDERQKLIEQFKILAASSGIRVGKGQISLPEHTVIAAHGKGEDFAKDLALLNCIAEIRKCREYADTFVSMRPSEQMEWAELLNSRIPAKNHDSPYVSVLDTGINRGHPLLDALLHENDNHTIDSEWTASDDDNHGTLMAGLCLFGDLTPILAGSHVIELPVNIEGAKIVPPPAQRKDDEKLAGAYTADGVALVEIKGPRRKRVWCITTTMTGPTLPIPTSWSSQIDRLASGVDNEGAIRRVLCLSAGNIPQNEWVAYPKGNYAFSVRNPAQSWNSLCIGAYTDFHLVRSGEEYTPLAKKGALAPVSSTSLEWESGWPNKPDVVFEGGNAGFQESNQSVLSLPEMMLLSTDADFANGAFGTASGTSPATALGARMAGQIMAEYPELTPETVRGLMVHSADWTSAMRESVPKEYRDDKRKHANFLLRTVGYGVPNLRNALECAKSRVTLIAETRIQPFKKDGNDVAYNQMHLHSLPWPDDLLKQNHLERVRMRVTLSYFVEPNPGNRGYTSNFRYASCGLRFKVSSPGQSAADLSADINKIAADEMRADGRGHTSGTTDGWLLGQACFRGSIHSDIWEGSAADLVSMQHVAVFPITGWWRTRTSHGRGDSSLPYSLIVSIESENSALDIYTQIEAKVNVPVEIPAE